MKNSKHTKLSVSGENILKPPKIEVVGIFPPNSKKYKDRNKRKEKGKERNRKVTYLYCLHYI